MHAIWKEKSNVLPISVILADFEINLGEFCGLEPPKIDYLCFRWQILNTKWHLEEMKKNTSSGKTNIKW